VLDYNYQNMTNSVEHAGKVDLDRNLTQEELRDGALDLLNIVSEYLPKNSSKSDVNHTIAEEDGTKSIIDITYIKKTPKTGEVTVSITKNDQNNNTIERKYGYAKLLFGIPQIRSYTIKMGEKGSRNYDGTINAREQTRDLFTEAGRLIGKK
jgi:hypothetical protein